jgi:anti-anti-sigma factor
MTAVLEATHAHQLPGDAGRVRSDRSPAVDATYDALDRTSGSCSVSVMAVNACGQEAALLSVRGEVDLGTAPLLREVLLTDLEHRSGPLVMDLSEVQFMDSSGVHVLVDIHRQLGPQNRRLAIACREHGQVHRLLALVGLLDTLAVHRSRESAVTEGEERIRSDPARDRAPLSA